MKTSVSVLFSTLLALGSVSAMAQYDDGGMGGADDHDAGVGAERGDHVGEAQEQESAFSLMDQNNDGVIDRDEAAAAGITDEQFDAMDRAGDDVISEQEYNDYVTEGPAY